MSEWLDIQTFGYSEVTDISGTALPPINIEPPTIGVLVDYILRDKLGEALLDKNNDTLSLEGLTYA